jgi:hypothetical protein
LALDSRLRGNERRALQRRCIKRQSDIAMPTLTDEAWAQLRHDDEHTERPIDEICAEHGISSGTLRDRVRRWDWTRRRPAIPDEGPPPLPAPRFEPPRAAAPPVVPAASVPAAEHETADAAPALPLHVDPALIAQRLQGAVARVLPAIETTLANLAATTAHPREVERAARALAALTRTLRELNALLGRYPVPKDEGPTNLDEFRRELARKMDAVIASRQERSDGAGPEA